jgi:hypothetical protein
LRRWIKIKASRHEIEKCCQNRYTTTVPLRITLGKPRQVRPCMIDVSIDTTPQPKSKKLVYSSFRYEYTRLKDHTTCCQVHSSPRPGPGLADSSNHITCSDLGLHRGKQVHCPDPSPSCDSFAIGTLDLTRLLSERQLKCPRFNLV